VKKVRKNFDIFLGEREFVQKSDETQGSNAELQSPESRIYNPLATAKPNDLQIRKGLPDAIWRYGR
jgi:hypothetical protein